MDHLQSVNNDSGGTSIDSSQDIDETDLCNNSTDITNNREKIHRESYKVSFDQTIVHRWFLSDVQSLHNVNEDFYVQSSSFGCTGEYGFLNWIIRFYPRVSKTKESPNIIDNNECHVKLDNENTHQNEFNTLRDMFRKNENQTPLIYAEPRNPVFNETLLKSISNVEQPKRIEEGDANKVISSEKAIHVPTLNNGVLQPLPQDSNVSGEEESTSDDDLYCAFEILKINGYEESSQTLFEVNYQIFDVADDTNLSLFKTEGRHPPHFNRAWIVLPCDTIFSIFSNNILFSTKLIIYECSSTMNYWQTIPFNSSSLSKISNGDTNESQRYNSPIELSTKNMFWLMSIQKLFTDIIICSSDGQEFHAHRHILYVSSEKFAELISMNQENNKIEIDSIQGIILKRILKYMYIGEIEIVIGEFSIDEIWTLFNAADFFKLFKLKNILTKTCINHITEKNCLDLLQIADDKKITVLKNHIITYLCQQHPQIFNTDLWQNFINSRPYLYNEILINLLRLNQLQKTIIENNMKEKTP